jgi:predicted house-cleaning noncanonical NTP pyrophosphatase (MazG superfamily)
MGKTRVDLVEKFQTDFDVFSDPLSAKSRSNAVGLEGRVHVYDLDGQAYYMPGGTHQEYLTHMEYGDEEEIEEVSEDRMVEAIRAVVAEIMSKEHKDEGFRILKVDEEQRIIYGWASVTTFKGEPVVDRQGDVIATETLHKAVNEFMKGVRVGKLLHQGEQVGEIIHSFPVTKEICEALGIQSEKEGWITGYFVTKDDLWEDVKAGTYAEFSIGGRAQKREFNAD